MTFNHLDLSAFKTHPYRQKRLKPYYAKFSKDDNHVLVDENVRDMLEAQGFHAVESPRSIYSVEKLFEALSGYAPHKTRKTQPSVEFQHGIALAYNCFAR